MQFSEQALANGETVFVMKDSVSATSFKRLTESIEKLFSAQRKNVSMPEAEVSNIHFGQSQVYAKQDFSYGCEFQCSGLTANELRALRTLLQGADVRSNEKLRALNIDPANDEYNNDRLIKGSSSARSS